MYLLIIIYLRTTLSLVKYICNTTTDIIYIHCTYIHTLYFFFWIAVYLWCRYLKFLLSILKLSEYSSLLILRVLQVNNSLLSDLIDTDIQKNVTNCHIVSNAYWGHQDSLLRAANTTVFIHSVLSNKLSLALKVTVLVFCLMYSQSQY